MKEYYVARINGTYPTEVARQLNRLVEDRWEVVSHTVGEEAGVLMLLVILVREL